MTALIAAAATPATGASAQPNQAQAPARIAAETRAGAAPVPLTPAQRSSLLKSAAKSATVTAGALKLGAEEKLLPKDVIKDADGTVHTRYERTFAGLPVLGGDLVVHQRGAGRTVSKATDAPVSVSTTDATVAASTAKKSALAAAKADGTGQVKADGTPRLVVWAGDGAPALAWESVVTGVEDDGSPREVHVVTDAKRGKKLREFETVHPGVGKGQFNGEVNLGSTRNGDVFELTDTQRGGHKTYDLGGTTTGTGTLFTDADDIWGDGAPSNRQTAAVDAAYGAQQTWDFYHDQFGRNGIANDGVGASSRVHYGNGVVNAYWDDDCFCMLYGDGKDNANPLTALDVAAHEMTHGVTSATADLYYYNGESGGLNEGSSDIMAAAVEFFTNNPNDVPDYEVGERIDINGDGTPLRYMDQPSKDGDSQDYWSTATEGLDPHYSSGVANHFFYLLAEGSGQKTVNGVGYNSPTYDSEPVPGLGLHNATNVWYRALTTYMTSTTDYAGARVATLQAAADLFGRSSEAYEAVGNTWAAVNVGPRFVNHVALPVPSKQESATGQPATLRIAADTSRPGSLTYEATGLPGGLAIDHETGVISGIPAEAGEFTPTVTVSAADGSAAEADFTWSVIASGGDFFVNPGDVRVPDLGDPVESPLIVTGRTGNAPSTLQVSVDIVHTYRGDLAIDLVGPGGTTYRLKNVSGDSGDDIHTTYTVDASAEPADGTWKLRVQDLYSGDTGYIDSWKLTF
ncbi:M4 family metallopeptidase [Streptomyces sp. NBC_00878]|uniref:M4 family metallopeptidase n=1 Tax=Streptomyces sp. NBC_00878 TaxID=2975854 RepID=UPI00225585C3|nr:M4 family metallopeptidase [Streptomyces sp. NBC_00878]MCX4911106.1 M4 family metallopeptidase [Streptomyces sp. NBC_00878]